MLKTNVETFLGCESPWEEARIVIYGAPFDSTTSFRPGTRFASRTMRGNLMDWKPIVLIRIWI